MSDEIGRHIEVGEWIRRIDQRATRISPWGRITMTVPSKHGLCWLVELHDGDVDIWRIDDLTVRYELLRERMKGEHSGRPGD